MAKRHWREWQYRGVAERGGKSVKISKLEEEDAAKSNGQRREEPEAFQLGELGNQLKISLQQAARDGREDVVRQWLQLLPKDRVDVRDSEGFTALHYAARFNKFKIVTLLVESGADASTPTDEEKLTPLHFAASFTPSHTDEATDSPLKADDSMGSYSMGSRSETQLSSKSTMEFLVHDCHVDVNCKDKYGVTPLHLACTQKNITAVEILLRAPNIDPHIKDNNHNTPLHEACQSGQKVIVEKLLQWMSLEQHTFDLSSPNRENRSPLHVASRYGLADIVKLILQYGFDNRSELVSSTDNEGSTPLHLACENNNEETVRILLLSEADVRAVKDDRVCALHIAAGHGSMSIAELLLESGLDIQATDIHQQTPLHYAARHNHTDMIKFLVEKNADLETRDRESYTPLLTAAVHGHKEAFKVLLENGARIDVIDKEGKNAVFITSENNHAALLKVILSHPKGPKLCNERDILHNTPLHIAAANGHHKVVDTLLTVEVQIKARNRFNLTPTHVAAENGKERVLRKLIASCKDVVYDEDDKGYTPLHFACRTGGGHLNAAKVLVDEGGAPVDSRNFKLWTPLTYAAKVGSEQLVELLIKAGAEIDPKDRFRQSPLHLACKEGHVKIVNILTSHGADVTQRDQNGYNALDFAVDDGHEEVAMAIVKGPKWAAVLRNVTQARWGGETTPLRKLIRKMPAVAEQVFDRCTVTNASKAIRPDSPEYRVIFNYEFLEDFRDLPSRTKRIQRALTHHRRNASKGDGAPDPAGTRDSEAVQGKKHGFMTDWGPEGFKVSEHILSILVESERTELLKHPLVTSLLDYKWKTYTRYVYFGNLFIYIMFLAFLSTFALVVHSPREDVCKVALSNSSAVDDCELGIHRSRFLFIAAIIIIFFAVVRLLMEALQSFQYRLAYLLSWVNWIENLQFACSIVFVFVFLNGCLCPYEWQWQIGAIAVFLGWIDLIIFIQKFPLTGIYVVMFVDIFYTFCRMIFLTVLLVIAFSLAFYMCFYDPVVVNKMPPGQIKSSFSTPALAVMKTMTMTTGEFDYEPLFRQEVEDGEDIAFPPVSYLLWIIFIILMPILLTNLLVGLAVDDIKGILEAAVLKRKTLQVELALSVEQRFPRRLRRFFITSMNEVAPNRKLSLWEYFVYEMWGGERYDSAENIAIALNPPVTSIEQQTRSLISDVSLMKQTLLSMDERNQRLEKIINKIAKKHDIKPGEVKL